jgi:hypothetical protein
MENYSNSDTFSELEYESSQGFVAGSDCDEDEPNQLLSANLVLRFLISS